MGGFERTEDDLGELREGKYNPNVLYTHVKFSKSEYNFYTSKKKRIWAQASLPFGHVAVEKSFGLSASPLFFSQLLKLFN